MNRRVGLNLAAACLAIALVLARTPVASAALRTDEVRTLAGQTIFGTIQLANDGQTLMVNAATGPVTVPIAEVLQADFIPPRPSESAPAPVSSTNTGLGVALPDGSIPAPWKRVDLTAAGAAHYAKGILSLSAAGAQRGPEGVHLVCEPIAGDFSLIARVAAMDTHSGLARCGLMACEELEQHSPGAEVFGSYPHGAISFTARGDHANQGDRLSRFDGPGTWFKLERSGENIVVYDSTDGQTWENLDSADVGLADRLYVGLFFGSRTGGGASFDQISLSTEAGEQAAAAAASKRVILSDGGILANVHFLGVDDSSMKLDDATGASFSVPLASVARLEMRPLAADALGKIPGQTSGVLLARGDFVEGDIQDIQNNKVQLSSVLVGLTSFDLPDVAAIVYRDVQPSTAAWLVRTIGGSAYPTTTLSLLGDRLSLNDPVLGITSVAMNQVSQIRAGGARFDDLVDLPATQGQFASAFVDGVIPRLVGAETSHPICLNAGESVTFNLNGRYKTLLALAGTPDRLMPAYGLVYTVLGDGRPLYRSAPLNSIDAPGSISISVSGIVRLTLRVDSPRAGPGLPMGVFSGAVLVK